MSPSFNSLYYTVCTVQVAFVDLVTCLAAPATAKEVAFSTQISAELRVP